MLKIWDASSFRRTLGGLCLIVGPLTVLAADFASSYGQTDNSAAATVASAAQHRDKMLVADYAFIVGYILFMVGVFALLQVVRGRGVVLAHIAGMICVVGLSLQLVFMGVLLTITEMGLPGVDRPAMVVFIQKAFADPAATPIALHIYVEGIGLFLFGIAVWRSGFGYRWAGALMSVAVVINFFPLNDIVSFVGQMLFVIALAAIGYRILTSGDAWESSPRSLAASAPAAAVVQ